MARSGLGNFRITRDARGVVTVSLDVRGRTYNVLSEDVIAELSAVVDELEHDPAAPTLTIDLPGIHLGDPPSNGPGQGGFPRHRDCLGCGESCIVALKIVEDPAGDGRDGPSMPSPGH